MWGFAGGNEALNEKKLVVKMRLEERSSRNSGIEVVIARAALVAATKYVVRVLRSNSLAGRRRRLSCCPLKRSTHENRGSNDDDEAGLHTRSV